MKLRLLQLTFFFCIAISHTACSTLPASQSASEQNNLLQLNEPLHFRSSNGNVTIVQPDDYFVEIADESRLRLIPQVGQETIDIEARTFAHEENVTSPTTLIMPLESENIHLALLLPQGDGMEAEGSPTGAFSRSSAQLNKPKLSKAFSKRRNQKHALKYPPKKTASNLKITKGSKIEKTQAKPAIGADVRLAGAPSAPTLQGPASGTTLSQENVIFQYRPGSGNPRPTHYKICVRDTRSHCGQPGTAVFPYGGQPAITGTRYQARLPRRFQGKEFQWSVAACAQSTVRSKLSTGPREHCTYSQPRPLRWALPAPHLKLPASNTTSNGLRPNLSIRGSVTGAEYYLYCISRPGVACPKRPTNTAQTVVGEVRGALRYQPPQDLRQFANQTIHWTAAACNALFGCVYQQSVHAVTLQPRRRIGPLDEDLAYRWAPIHYQDTAGNGKSDYITAFNYDGDWNAQNNWDNLDRFPLRAAVYYSISETDTHWFIAYAFFHPRDWSTWPPSFRHGNDGAQHENDMEGLLMIVRRSGGRFGQLEAMVTNSHQDFYSYLSPGSTLQGRSGGEDIDGTIRMMTHDGALHPATAQEAHGHGLKAYPQVGMDGSNFRGGDGVIYYPSRNQSEVPANKNDRHVKYRLINVFSPNGLWDHRRDPLTLNSTSRRFSGNFLGDASSNCGKGVRSANETKIHIARALAKGGFIPGVNKIIPGSKPACQLHSARPFWRWDDHNDPVGAGVITTDSVTFTQRYFSNLGNFSTTYTKNPYNRTW